MILIDQFEIDAVGSFQLTRALLSNLKLDTQMHESAKAVQITFKWGSIALNQ